MSWVKFVPSGLTILTWGSNCFSFFTIFSVNTLRVQEYCLEWLVAGNPDPNANPLQQCPKPETDVSLSFYIKAKRIPSVVLLQQGLRDSFYLTKSISIKASDIFINELAYSIFDGLDVVRGIDPSWHVYWCPHILNQKGSFLSPWLENAVVASRIPSFDLLAASRIFTIKAVEGSVQVARYLQVITLTCLWGHVIFAVLTRQLKQDEPETMAVYSLESCSFE